MKSGGAVWNCYRVVDLALHRRSRSMKALPPQFAFDPVFVRRFQQEAITAAGLHHPHIVTIHDVGAQNDIHYIVMQLLKGVTLDKWVEESKAPMPAGQANQILQQIADALDEAHAQGVVHRDIKPSNIMLRPDGHVTVMDFGLVRAGEGTGLTWSGMVVGTPEYMSPEQALDQPVDGRTDHAVGIVLFKLLTGHVPFSRSSAVSTILADVNDPLPSLRQITC